jgi:hypothetical protein
LGIKQAHGDLGVRTAYRAIRNVAELRLLRFGGAVSLAFYVLMAARRALAW